ncbi:MAG TPA: DUF4124 domain-containing protein [Usitatibacter sp.]|nr:DUF4124 domain-containing protein [Usitatibacter sp.]
MKGIVVLALGLAFVPMAGAQLYKYVDKDGKTVYSDQPPANIDSKQISAPAPRGAAPAAGPKTAVERDKELDKARKEAKDKQEKSEKSAQKAQEEEQRCQQARSAYQGYSDGGRLYKYNDKGERVFMEDAEIEAAREKARKDMDGACKKG